MAVLLADQMIETTITLAPHQGLARADVLSWQRCKKKVRANLAIFACAYV